MTQLCEVMLGSLIDGGVHGGDCPNLAAYLLHFDPAFHYGGPIAACLAHTMKSREHPNVHLASAESLAPVVAVGSVLQPPAPREDSQ